jgi:hypothetical protein
LRPVRLTRRVGTLGTRRAKQWLGCLGIGIALLTFSGCSTLHHVFHTDDKGTKRAAQLQVLQLSVMRFADEYAGSITQPIRSFQASTDNAADRLTAQNWLLSQATAAYTIASGPSPVVNTVDLVVLTTLSRMVIDDAWAGERFGERAAPLREAYHRLEPLALELAKRALTADQIAELQHVIVEWREQNPHVTAISYVHFRDVASSMGKPKAGGSDRFGGLFSVLGLDPLSGLDPAVREISQSRELAERTIYYAQRLPNLLDMQIERLTFEFATMPEVTRLLANADHVAGAATTTARVVGELPTLLPREREAAIRQFMEAVTVESAHTRELVVELRAALEAGTATSNSLDGTIRSFDQLVARLEKPARADASAQTSPAKPFDIAEYTAAAAEITRSAAQLESLIGSVDRGSPALAQVSEHAAATLRSVVDHAYWRGAQLLGVLIVGALGAALVYRMAARRWLT